MKDAREPRQAHASLPWMKSGPSNVHACTITSPAGWCCQRCCGTHLPSTQVLPQAASLARCHTPGPRGTSEGACSL